LYFFGFFKEIDMLKQPFLSFIAALSLGVLAACSNTPYVPVAAQVAPVDVTAYAPKVDAFVVLLDTSGSMKEEYQGRPKIEAAQDTVASFNGAVPPLGFQSGLVIFGRGADTCWGYGAAQDIYGLTAYDSAAFAQALGSIKCAASTTPIVDAIDIATGLLVDHEGPTAVIVVSDFKWSDTAAVEAAVAGLKSQHGNNVCLHTVKVGDDTTGDAVIGKITGAAGCDSAVGAGDLASGAAMSTYVAETLMAPLAPLQYEKHTVSAVALFDFDKSVLKQQGKAELQNVGAKIRDQGMSVGDIDVIGYTDSVGSNDYNYALSERRANAVKDYLVSEGIDADLIDAIGKGKSEPVASNDTEEGRAKNRRVEIHVGTSRLVK
jgi:OOP family OmpA-OmpF porin